MADPGVTICWNSRDSVCAYKCMCVCIYIFCDVHNHFVLSDLSRLLMEAVPRSMLLSTSPVLRPRCQRRERECRWEKRRTWTTRLVYCCTRIHRKERMLLTKPEEPGDVAQAALQCYFNTNEMPPHPTPPESSKVITCSATLQELEQDVNTHCLSQSLPVVAIGQIIH